MRSALLFTSVVAAASACLPTPCFAQQAPAPSTTTAPATTQPTGDTIRLSDKERDAILNSNTVESAAAARGERLGPGSGGPGIHGEIGAMIGSNGTRGIYGTAAIPLGYNAGAVVSFESSQYNWPRRSR